MNQHNTQNNQPESWAEQLLRNKTAGELRRMYPKISFFYLVSAAAAFAASFMFVGGVWLGADWNPDHWETEQWVAVGIALLMVGGITAGQYFSYDSGIKSRLMIFAKAVVILFALGSEVSQTMEREAETVRNRSADSAVFKATVGAIQSATNAPVQVSPALADAQADAATAQVEIEACERHRAKGQARVDKCLRIERGNLAAAQARIQAMKDAATTTAQANQSTALAMVEQAKALQFDDNQRFQGIQFIQKILGVSAIVAAFIFAFGIIGTFEAMFWLLGVLRGAISTALKSFGLTAEGKLIADEYREMGLMQEETPAPPPAPKQPHNQYTPSQSVGFSPSPTLANFNQYKQSGHPVPAAAASADWLADKLSGKGSVDQRVFKLLYTEIRAQVMAGELKPAIRPVMEAITTIARKCGGVPASLLDAPQRQQLAQAILLKLEQDGITARNPESSIGQPRYILSPKYSTYNRELANHQIDCPDDAVLNQADDKATIERIIAKGKAAGLGTHETQLAMNLHTHLNGTAKPVQQTSLKPLADGHETGSAAPVQQTVSKPLANGQNGLYGEWVKAVQDRECLPSVKPTWLWIQKRISNKETGSRTHDRTRITTMQKAFFSRAISDGLMKQNPNYRNGGKKYIWTGA
jgi:hypothetical protein